MSSAQILEERPIGRTMLGQGKPPRDQREAREAHYLDARLMGNPRTKPFGIVGDHDDLVAEVGQGTRDALGKRLDSVHVRRVLGGENRIGSAVCHYPPPPSIVCRQQNPRKGEGEYDDPRASGPRSSPYTYCLGTPPPCGARGTSCPQRQRLPWGKCQANRKSSYLAMRE